MRNKGNIDNKKELKLNARRDNRVRYNLIEKEHHKAEPLTQFRTSNKNFAQFPIGKEVI